MLHESSIYFYTSFIHEFYHYRWKPAVKSQSRYVRSSTKYLCVYKICRTKVNRNKGTLKQNEILKQWLHETESILDCGQSNVLLAHYPPKPETQPEVEPFEQHRLRKPYPIKSTNIQCIGWPLTRSWNFRGCDVSCWSVLNIHMMMSCTLRYVRT